MLQTKKHMPPAGFSLGIFILSSRKSPKQRHFIAGEIETSAITMEYISYSLNREGAKQANSMK
jgi:hypothetical protein